MGEKRYTDGFAGNKEKDEEVTDFSQPRAVSSRARVRGLPQATPGARHSKIKGLFSCIKKLHAYIYLRYIYCLVKGHINL